MGWTKRNRWTKDVKKRSTEKHLKQKKMLKNWLLNKQLEENNYSYDVSVTTYSSIKCMMHSLKLTKELPGRDALKEVLTFLKSHPEYPIYELALKSALQKVKGRRFIDEIGRDSVIQSLDDVTQVIRESLRTAGICKISVKNFIYNIVSK